jgi:hypothetical protein
MNEHIKEVWLPWTLYVATLAAAACLGIAVLIAPWIADPAEPSLWTLYANDLTVRRTSIFSALGLAATAFIFFKPKRTPPKASKPDASSNVAGA